MMRILVMGGTRFIGRHFVAAALRNGHSVTLFHRGASAGLFPEAAHLLGDRDHDLRPLEAGVWDATVDLSAYLPRQVRSLAAELNRRAGVYVFLSSTAVYAAPQSYGFDENSDLVRLTESEHDEAPADAGTVDDRYGGLKVLCEEAAQACFGECLILRPTYVVGPLDYTGRFTYWVERIAAGGMVLCPGPPSAMFQLIDARDLAAWMVRMIESGGVGTYNVAAPFPPASFEHVLTEIRAAVPGPDAAFEWVDRSFLLEAGMDSVKLPLWPGANPDGIIEAANPGRALAAGLRIRPLRQTIADIHQQEVSAPTPISSPVGLAPEEEKRLLQLWQQSKARR
jgi:2'-hydroxyisoflavone reductase